MQSKLLILFYCTVMRFNLPAYFIGDLDTKMAGFRAIAHPEVSVWTTAVVMQVRNVNGFAV
jgi:hypothetical protein